MNNDKGFCEFRSGYNSANLAKFHIHTYRYEYRYSFGYLAKTIPILRDMSRYGYKYALNFLQVNHTHY